MGWVDKYGFYLDDMIHSFLMMSSIWVICLFINMGDLLVLVQEPERFDEISEGERQDLIAALKVRPPPLSSHPSRSPAL